MLKSGVDASLKKTALGKPAMVVPNPLNIYIYWIIVFLIIFTMILMIVLVMTLMTTLMIIGMRERPGAPIIGPAGRLADRHQPGLCHHRQHCHHHIIIIINATFDIIASLVIIITIIIILYETPLMKLNLHQNLWIAWK